MKIAKEDLNLLIQFQRNEITEHLFYDILSKRGKGKNKEVLEKISSDELKHYNIIKNFTNLEIKENKFFIYKNLILTYIFGLTFGIKLMENGESKAQKSYENLINNLDENEKEIFKNILLDENKHENELLSLIDEEKVNFIGSIVLGINDALIELTGALAGLTFTLKNSSLIFVVGFITGFAATLSMASSEYLSKKAEKDENAGKASIYTGITYILTVILLMFPYLIFKNYTVAFIITLIMAIIVILITSYFVSTVKELSFKNRFIEMAFLSLGIAFVSYIFGYLLRILFNVEV
ncbi:MAG TPA: VIT1/CCC1 transporter family protein [Caldisericia bacterium]|nr:VIT1/CCC1 transporter family protein [Caldisericia bacterium]HQN49065.1 VIT1/CCC1 transporter family protein [Caldisericia bacterium]